MHEGKNELGARDIVIPPKNDNQGSIALAYNSIFDSKAKYINI